MTFILDSTGSIVALSLKKGNMGADLVNVELVRTCARELADKRYIRLISFPKTTSSGCCYRNEMPLLELVSSI